MKLWHTSILIALMHISSYLYADAPLTSMEFYVAYQDSAIIQLAAQSGGILTTDLMDYLIDESNPIDLKLAIINRLGWYSDGKNNSALFYEYLRCKNQNPYTYEATADIMICFACLIAMDDDFIFAVDAMPYALKAKEMNESSLTINLFCELAISNSNRVIISVWPEVRTHIYGILNNDNLVHDMKPEAIRIIIDHLERYNDFYYYRLPVSGLDNDENWSVELSPYDEPPALIGSITPELPDSAIKTYLEGTVVLEAQIDSDGVVGKVRVHESVQGGPGGLDEAAISAVRRARFEPGRVNGEPVDSRLFIPVEFTRIIDRGFPQMLYKAQAGDVEAQYWIGSIYDYGHTHFIQADDTEALRWYRLAAEQGYTKAQMELAEYYSQSYDVEPNYTEAMRWYRLAVENGNAEAYHIIGVFYDYGYGVEQDSTEAVRWYRQASERGDALAQTTLGWCYEWGLGVSQDYAEAMRWYRLAADQGIMEAQFRIGLLYKEGKGVDVDLQESYYWLNLACYSEIDVFYEEAEEARRRLSKTEFQEVMGRVDRWYQEHNYMY